MLLLNICDNMVQKASLEYDLLDLYGQIKVSDAIMQISGSDKASVSNISGD